MKILLVSTELTRAGSPQGGLANSVERLAGALVDRGHEARLLSYGPRKATEWKGPVLSEWVDVPCPRWMLALNFLTLLRFSTIHTALIRARAIARRVNELRAESTIDLVHYPNLQGIGLRLPKAMASVCRISSDTALCHQAGAFETVSGRHLRQTSFLEYRSLRRARKIYAPSQKLADLTQAKSGRRVEVIPTLFFPEVKETEKPSLNFEDPDAPFLMYAGNLNRLKGIEDIGHVLKKILECRENLHFVFAGPQKPRSSGTSWENWLRTCAGEKANRLVFPGALPHTQLYPLYRHAEAVVLPSRMDNLPNTLLEAMYHGGIVVGTRGATFDEVIQDGLNGFLCEAENPPSLLQSLQRVLALDSSRSLEIRAHARETMRAYSPSEILPRLEKLFEEALQEKPA